MRTMFAIPTVLLVLAAALACNDNGASLEPEASETAALAAALIHARSVIPDGTIQVSPDSAPAARYTAGSVPPERSLLKQATRRVGFSFGPDDEAVTCEPLGRCHVFGRFRGLVHVAEYARPDPDLVVVTLRMLQFTPERDRVHVYEQVDELHLTRRGRSADWRIEKVTRLTES